MSHLFSPMRIGSLELRNRFVRSATFEGMAKENGEVSDDILKLYRNLAKGGIGLLITGHFYVNQLGKAFFNQVGIYSDEMIPGLKRLVQEVHEHGGKVVFQLAHAGRQTTRKITGQRPVGPSGKGRDPIFFVKPREMTEDDIQQTIQSFGRAAKRAVEAGADGIQLHGAHGYLINQFLSPFYNTRNDAWGGSEEGRFRFLEHVFSEIKRAIPTETPILIKLNTHDHTPRQGVTPELAAHYAQRLAGMGIDAVEISSGSTFYSFMDMCRGSVPVQELVDTMPFFKKPIAKIMMKRLVGKFDLEEGYHLQAAKTIKPVLGEIPLVLVGGMRRVNHMEEILEKGYADFISMSRPFVREPLLVKRIEAGKTDVRRASHATSVLEPLPTGCPYAVTANRIKAASRGARGMGGTYQSDTVPEQVFTRTRDSRATAWSEYE